jgi:hypothetical protein
MRMKDEGESGPRGSSEGSGIWGLGEADDMVGHHHEAFDRWKASDWQFSGFKYKYTGRGRVKYETYETYETD